MGIKNLNKFLRNNCPEIYEEIHISKYCYKKIAIDISLYVCKFKAACGDKWLSAFINLIVCLRKNEVHCVFIYDGGAPPEKDLERKERAKQRQKAEEKVLKLEYAMEKYDLTNEIDPILVELYKKKTTGFSLAGYARPEVAPDRRLLKKDVINMNIVRDLISKMRNNILDITPEDFKLTKKLFDILKVPYYDAPLEAETMCSDLCKKGLVDAVLSEDTDVLAYAAPVFLSKINTSNGTCIRIKYPKLLKKLDITAGSFLDLCIMCGTDYNKNIFRVGPEKAYKYIQEHQTIENIAKKTKLDITVLNHLRVRQLFRKYETKNVTTIPYCGLPDFIKLTRFVFKYNINCYVDGLKNSFINNTIIFEE